MVTNENLKNELLHLLATTNNYLMDLEVKGDNILKSADIMQRCVLLYNHLKGVENVEVNREADDGAGEPAGSND